MRHPCRRLPVTRPNRVGNRCRLLTSGIGPQPAERGRADPQPAGRGRADALSAERVDALSAERGGAGLAGAERGGATVWLLAAGLVFVLVGLFGAALGAARAARHQARNAADFGALAGAGRALDGPGAACARADELARANGGRLVACRLDGLDVIVTAERKVVLLPWLAHTTTATSRAGPPRG